MSRAHATLYAAFALGVSGGAAAQDPAIALEWSGGGECMQAAELEAGVEAMLGYDAFGTPGSATLAGSVRRDGRAHVVMLELRREGAEPETRELRARASRCRELDSVVIVAAGLLVDDARQRILDLARAEDAIANAAAGEPEPEPESEPGPATEPEPERETEPEAEIETETLDVRGHLDLAGTVSAGLLPSPAFGVTLGGGVHLERLRISASFVYYPGAESPDSPSVLVDAYAGRLTAGIALLREGIVELAAALEATAGAFRGRGVTLSRADTSVLPYADVGGSARAELRATEALAGFLELAVLIPLVAPRFFANVDGVERTLHQSGPIGFAASFGLTLRLGS